MPAVSEASIRFAVRNIASHGDTDVFPFPLENRWFADAEDDVVKLLVDLDRDFEKWIAEYPIIQERGLGAVGYTGFRAATQIDPVWNAYFLALAIELAEDIEKARLPAERGIVFSYRYRPDLANYTMFDRDLGWAAFHRSALAEAENYPFVLSTDISDFYQRVYHHRLDNALKQTSENKDAIGRVQGALFRLSNRTSYGLPIGGNASRLLAEILLNRVDRLLLGRRIVFKRFVDDYLVFTEGQDEAQKALAVISQTLMVNEGFSLSRLKTRLMSRSEFRRSSPLADPAGSSSQDESKSRQFLKIRLAYDPYAPTAEGDYERLASEIGKFDIVGMLSRELGKSRIDEGLTRQLVKSVKFLDDETRNRAILSLMQNLKSLYPVFPSVAILLRAVLADLDEGLRADVYTGIRGLLQNQSYIVHPTANLAFAIRILMDDRSEETDALLIELYERPSTSPMLKRDIILLMTRRRVDYWLSETLKRATQLGVWERRAVNVASYVLGDEGRHWRDGTTNELSAVDRVFRRWVGAKNNGTAWEVPL